MEIITPGYKETVYVGTCKCGCVAKYTRSEATENIPVIGGLPYGLIVKCPICDDGYLYSPYTEFVEDKPEETIPSAPPED